MYTRNLIIASVVEHAGCADGLVVGFGFLKLDARFTNELADGALQDDPISLADCFFCSYSPAAMRS
jgi:hypothetical protein